MAEERYNYNMAVAIDKLLKETTGLQVVNSERILTLEALARESRAMRAAALEYAASQVAASGSSISESLNSGLSASESSESLGDPRGMGASLGDLDESDESCGSDEYGIWHGANSLELSAFSQQNNTRRDEAYRQAVEHFVLRLRNWRMELEEAKYESIDFDLPLTNWTRRQKITMRTEIRNMSYEIRKKTIIEKMVELNKRRVSKGLTEETKLAVEMIELLLQDIFLLRIMPFKDVVFPLTMENIYDWDRVSDAIKRTHTPAECQEFWYTKSHPVLNGKCWSKAENRKLVALADAYNLHHWDEIAKDLNTSRTGFQCYVQYRRYLYKDKPVVIILAQENDAKDG